jgi:putative ABC transport system permease protein
MVAVATVVAVGAIADNLLFTYRRPFEAMKRPDLWITTGPVGGLPVSLRFDEDFGARLAQAVPWVSKTIGTQFSYTTLGNDRVLVEGLAEGTTQPMLAALPHNRRAALFDDAHPAVIVNAAFADTNHVHVGSRFRLTTALGPKTLTVLGVVNVPSPSPTGRVALDRRLVARFFGQTGVSFVEVYGKKGISRDQLQRLVAASLRDSPTRAWVATGTAEYEGVVSSLRQSTAIFEAMRVAVLLATALALANAMLISVVERRRELGIVRAVGTSRRQLRRMVVVESFSIVIVGSILGTFNGLLQHRVGVKAIGTLLKTTIDYRFVGTPIMGALVAMGLTAIVAAVVPAARAANVNVIEAIGYE